jgi:hypothetical protein
LRAATRFRPGFGAVEAFEAAEIVANFTLC